MRQPINFNEDNLDVMAEKATTLSNWLVEKAASSANQVTLPSNTVTVVSVILVAGTQIWMDGAIPDSACWGGCGRV